MDEIIIVLQLEENFREILKFSKKNQQLRIFVNQSI